jgi:uncharacterized protein (TIGR03435 family)
MTMRLAAIISRIVVPVGFTLAAWAQSPPAGPAFEVASMKVSPPSFPPNMSGRGGPGSSSPGEWSVNNATVRFLIAQGWGFSGYRLSGPPIMDSEHYDIAAKLPPDTSREDFKLMIQRLVVERLGLVVHHEAKEQAVYELVIAKGGPKLKESEPAPPDAPEVRGLKYDKDGNPLIPTGLPMAAVLRIRGVMHGVGHLQDIGGIARMFESTVGRPIVDKTGLTGKYDYALAFAPEGTLGSASPAEASEPTGAEPFMVAFERQLGLKLVPAKGSLDVLVVDRFNKVPSEN